MGRAPCCDKANVKKGQWSPEEDAKLKGYIEKNGTGNNWIALPQKIGLKRCGKSCRLRWLNYLRPNLKHGGFSEEEDNIICSLYITIGSRWSIIAAQLPGRTDNDIKNYWNTKLKKRLLGKQHQQLQLQQRKPQQTVKRENEYRFSYTTGLQLSWLAPELPEFCPSPLETKPIEDPKEPIRNFLVKSSGDKFYEDDILASIGGGSTTFSQVPNTINRFHQGLDHLGFEAADEMLLYGSYSAQMPEGTSQDSFSRGTDHVINNSAESSGSVSNWGEANSLAHFCPPPQGPNFSCFTTYESSYM